MKKMNFNRFKFAAVCILGIFSFSSCEFLQSTLSSEQESALTEATGSASIDGKCWYFDGISTTDFSSVSGASLAVNFSKKVKMSGTVNNDGSITYDLNGSLTANYVSTTGQTSQAVYKISEGKVILDSVNSVSESAGSLNKSGTVFSLNMAPICALLDAQTVKGNSIDSVEVKLNGFVCAEGDQKGRSIGTLNQKISVKPFFADETITEGVIFSTASSTTGKYITIPTNAAVSLTDDATLTFATDDESVSLTSSNFTLGTSSDGITILCDTDLKDCDFVATFTVEGFIPELNASSYTRDFTVNITPQLVTLDGVLDEDAWQTATVSSDSYSSEENYDLSKVYVTNDATSLYIAIEGNLAFGDGDRINILIDNSSSTETGKANTDSDYNSYYGPATNATFESVDFFLSHLLSSAQMQDYKWISDSGRSDGVETSLESGTTATVIEYKIPLSVIASAASGNELKIFVTATSYKWNSQDEANEMTMRDCIPSSAATVSDGGQTLAIDFTNALSYTVAAAD